MAETDGHYQTFEGAGFGTLMVKLTTGPRPTPPVVSNRAYLRASLPAIYQESDFGMRFVGALESVLDPIVAVLDALPQHFMPDYAPRDILELLSAWLGIDVDEALDVEDRRELVRNAAELGRRRGTRLGMELALRLAFPDVPLRVEDPGGVTWTLDPSGSTGDGAGPDGQPAAPQFVVYCDKPVAEDTQAAIARCIEQHKPIHTSYRLRVKAAKKAPQETE